MSPILGDFLLSEFQDIICSNQKSGTMRVSLQFSKQMSLQLGHRWVSLKHQKQMGSRKGLQISM